MIPSEGVNGLQSESCLVFICSERVRDIHTPIDVSDLVWEHIGVNAIRVFEKRS